MSSSPIEARHDPASLHGARIGEARHAIEDSRWYKRLLPRTLFGRSLLIIATPLILVWVITTWKIGRAHV